MGCFSCHTTPAPGVVSQYPQTKHSCNLIKSVSEAAGVWRHRPSGTAEGTHPLQGGPQLRIVALQLAPVNFQLCHRVLQTFKSLCQAFLLLHSRTRLSLYSLQGRPTVLIWAALHTGTRAGGQRDPFPRDSKWLTGFLLCHWVPLTSPGWLPCPAFGPWSALLVESGPRDCCSSRACLLSTNSS